MSGQFPARNADVVASTVVAPIEEQINGVENMIYMSSNSNGDGRFSIGVSFDIELSTHKHKYISRLTISPVL